MQNKPTQNYLRTMVESHDVDINELRERVRDIVEKYDHHFTLSDGTVTDLRGKIDSIDNLDQQTLMILGMLVDKLNAAKARIKELEINNAKQDTIYLALHELSESNKMMGQFLAQRFGYSPTPLTHVPQKINSVQHEAQSYEADGRLTPPINTPVAKPPVNTPVGNTRVDLEELHILMKEGWTQKQLEQHFGKSEYVIHEAKRKVRAQWFDV